MGLVEKIDDGMRDYLDSPFTKEEIKQTIFYLGPTKAPGLGGFHATFFQKFWCIVGDNVIGTCLKVLNRGCSIRRFNNTNVILIPKKIIQIVCVIFNP